MKQPDDNKEHGFQDIQHNFWDILYITDWPKKKS